MSSVAFALIYLIFCVIQWSVGRFKASLSLFVSFVAGIANAGVYFISSAISDVSSSQSFLCLTSFFVVSAWAYTLDRLNSNAVGFVYLLMIIKCIDTIDFFSNSGAPLFSDSAYVMLISAINVFVFVYCMTDRDNADRVHSVSGLFARRTRIK